MLKEEIEIVHKAIEIFGDDFWTEGKEISEVIVSNKHLFDEIVTYVNKHGYDLKLTKLEREKILEREYVLIAVTNTEDLSESWNEEVVADRKFISGTFAEFGMAEECVGFLELGSKDKLTYEVGVGECLRPYRQVYLGEDIGIASKTFIDTINELKTFN
jgi:hypothetical protein